MRTRRRQLIDDLIRAAIDWRDSIIPGTRQARYYATERLLVAINAICALEVEALHTPRHTANAEGPPTQHEAAELAKPSQASVRWKIITALAAAPNSDETLERWLKIKHQTLSSARNWLADHGWVEDSGLRAVNRSGRRAIIWRLTPAGRTAYTNMKESS